MVSNLLCNASEILERLHHHPPLSQHVFLLRQPTETTRKAYSYYKRTVRAIRRVANLLYQIHGQMKFYT